MTRAADPRIAHRGRRRVGIVVAIAAFALLRPGISAEARPATLTSAVRLQGGEVSGFIGQINGLRSALGLGQLAVSSQLTQVASSWSQHMAAEGRISHNPNLTSQVSGWSGIAENVGVGWDVLGLMDAFIGSPHHYTNLVNPAYTLVGVGVAFGADGAMYTTHNFMTPDQADEPAPQPDPEPAPAPDPEPAPAPRTSAPRSAATPAPVPEAPAVPTSQPTEVRVAAILEPLRALETR